MGRSPLISFTGSPEDGDVSKHDSERGKRHYHGKKRARLFNHDWYCHTPFTWSHKVTCVKRKFCMGHDGQSKPSTADCSKSAIAAAPSLEIIGVWHTPQCPELRGR